MISGTEEAIKNLLRPIFEEWIFDETMSKADFETMVTDYLITALTELAYQYILEVLTQKKFS